LTQIVLTDAPAKKLDAQLESLSLNAVSMALYRDWKSVQQSLLAALHESHDAGTRFLRAIVDGASMAPSMSGDFSAAT